MRLDQRRKRHLAALLVCNELGRVADTAAAHPVRRPRISPVDKRIARCAVPLLAALQSAVNETESVEGEVRYVAGDHGRRACEQRRQATGGNDWSIPT